MSLKQRMSHGPVTYVPDLELARHNDHVREADYDLVVKLTKLKDSRNPNWIALKSKPSCVGNRKNRSGQGPEHSAAIIENAWHDALIENASRILATQIDSALNG
jgi:hypothetical protein